MIQQMSRNLPRIRVTAGEPAEVVDIKGVIRMAWRAKKPPGSMSKCDY